MAVRKKSGPTTSDADAPPAAASDAASGDSGAPMLRLKELLDQVASRADVPKKAVREVSAAVLEVLGAALERGDEVNLPGLGRIKVVKTADKGGRPVLTLKLKRGAGNGSENKVKAGKEGLAQPDEDS